MKTTILTVAMSLMVMTSFSQDYNDLLIAEAPLKTWFMVDDEDLYGVMFMQDKDNSYIVNYVSEMLMEDSIRFDRPKEEIIKKPGVYTLEWEYVQVKSNKRTYVTYTKEEKYSYITFQEEE